MQYQLTDDALAAYRQDGFVAIKKLITESETDRLRTILMNLHVNNIGFAEGALFDAAGLDDGAERTFPQIIDPRLIAPELEKSEYFEVGLAIAKRILGKTARLRGDITFLKPPHIGSSTPWHQDEAFANPLYDYNQISIWLALTPAGVVNSCMSFVPGSHRLPVLDHQPLGGDPRIHALECISDFDRAKVVECPLPVGGCTIHDHRTLHYAGPNYSSQGRLAYVIVYDTTPVMRREPREFAWRQFRNMTARSARERQSRLKQGFFVYLWRQRKRIHLDRGLAELKRAKAAIKVMRRNGKFRIWRT